MDARTRAKIAALFSTVLFTIAIGGIGAIALFGHMGGENKELSAMASALKIFPVQSQSDLVSSLRLTIPKIQDGNLLVDHSFLFIMFVLLVMVAAAMAVVVTAKEAGRGSIYDHMFGDLSGDLSGVGGGLAGGLQPAGSSSKALARADGPQEIMFDKTIDDLKNAIQELTKIVDDGGSGDDLEPIKNRCDDYYEKIIKIASKSNLICNGAKEAQKSAHSASQRIQKLSNKCRNSSNFAAATQLEWKKNSMISTISQVGRSYDKIQDLVTNIKSTSESCNRLLVESFNTEKVVKEKREQIVTRLGSVQADSVVAFRHFDKLFEEIGDSGDRVREAGMLFDQISKRSETIGQIVRAFENVSEQINLQTLNASIEAAKYGPRGQEFSEIAEEIRKLSDKSSHATRTLTNLLSSVQEEIEKGVSLVSSGGDSINESYKIAQKCQEYFRTSSSASKKVISDLDLVKTDASIQTNKLAEIENLNKVNLDSFEGLKDLLRKELGANSKICTESTKLAEHCEELSSLLSKQYFEMTHCSKLLEGTVNSLLELEGHANEGKHIVYGLKSSVEDGTTDSLPQHPIYAVNQKVAASKHLSSLKTTTEALEVLRIKKA